MKTAIHPEYRPVVLRDRSAGHAVLTCSRRTSGSTVTWEDGQDYPVVDVEVSAASHPFSTGRSRTWDTTGRVGEFERRFGRRQAS